MATCLVPNCENSKHNTKNPYDYYFGFNKTKESNIPKLIAVERNSTDKIITFSTICSRHFDPADIVRLPNGTVHIREEAISKYFLGFQHNAATDQRKLDDDSGVMEEIRNETDKERANTKSLSRAIRVGLQKVNKLKSRRQKINKTIRSLVEIIRRKMYKVQPNEIDSNASNIHEMNISDILEYDEDDIFSTKNELGKELRTVLKSGYKSYSNK